MKRLWRALTKKSLVDLFVGINSILSLLIGSKLRLGAHLLRPLRRYLEKKSRELLDLNFSEVAALYHAWNFAEHAFTVENSSDLARLYPKYSDQKVIALEGGIRALVMRYGDEVHVSIRGSANLENWETNFETSPSYAKEVSAFVHSGYSKSAETIKDALILERLVHPNDRVKITGASLGHAVSILLGWYLKDDGYRVVSIIGFGGPRVSFDDYSDLPVINVFNVEDPVMYLPGTSILHPYRHQGTHYVYSENKWWRYRDCAITDWLLSPLFLYKEVNPSEHMRYSKRLKELINGAP